MEGNKNIGGEVKKYCLWLFCLGPVSVWLVSILVWYVWALCVLCAVSWLVWPFLLFLVLCRGKLLGVLQPLWLSAWALRPLCPDLVLVLWPVLSLWFCVVVLWSFFWLVMCYLYCVQWLLVGVLRPLWVLAEALWPPCSDLGLVLCHVLSLWFCVGVWWPFFWLVLMIMVPQDSCVLQPFLS